MTDDAAPLERLRYYADQIEATKRNLRGLEAARDREIVDLIGDEPDYGVISAAARAAKLTRQRVDGIRRLARARREGQHDPKS